MDRITRMTATACGCGFPLAPYFVPTPAWRRGRDYGLAGRMTAGPRMGAESAEHRHRKRQESRQIPILPDDSRHEPLESPDADTGNSGTTEL
jgi:hypothetical protein